MSAGIAGLRARSRRSLVACVAVGITALALVAPGAHAAVSKAGSLDRTFSNNGKASVRIGQPSDYAYALALQPDGDILVAGTANAGVSNTDLGLVRFRPDGTKDPAFGHHGKVQTDLGRQEDAFDVALQPDGRIVAVGWSAGNMIVVRYRPNGRLDPGFGRGGVVTIDIDRYDMARAVAIQPDSAIVVAGLASDGSLGRPVLARLLRDGSLDGRFGTGGLVIGKRKWHFAPEDLSLQPDGRIVVSGVRLPNVEVRRYLPDGRSDASFGSRGRVDTPLSPSMHTAVALRPDGDIVVTGTLAGDHGDFGVAALRPDGSLDPTFGTNGTAQVDFGGTSDQALAAAVSADGSVVLGGDTVGRGRLFAVARLLPDGSLDASFGHDGRVSTGGGELGFVQDLALDGSGRIVAAGVASPQGDLRFMALRFLSA